MSQSTKQAVERRRCDWHTCRWHWYVIVGSNPSEGIFDIARAGHLRDVHDNKVPATNFNDELFRQFFKRGGAW